MPGVPSGRGCNACRRSKKKCDQAQPVCSRCRRLRMECTGAGQRRFKFIHQDGPTEQGGPGQQLSIVQVPASRDALIAGNLGSRLQVADIRYDTSWLGDFLHMIPERIGTNKALDSAADTFTTGFNNLDNPHGQPTQMLTKYGDTLRALRDTIGDPAQREAPETMYAMYLVLLSEGLFQHSHGFYARGMVYLLQSQSYRKWTSRFDLTILKVVCSIVLMESIGNPTVQLEPWLPKLLDQIDPVRPNSRSATSPFPSLELRAVANVAVALREPWLHHDQLLESYNSLIFDREKLLNYYHEVSAVGSTNHGDTYLSKKAIRFSASALCKASTMALATNRMLQEFHPDDMELFAMGETLIREIIDLGDRILPIKPLGSAHLVPGLNIAWAATRDPKQKEYLARQLCDLHSCGYPAGVPLREARWWALKFGDVQRRLRKRGLLSPFSCSDDSYGEEEQEIPHEHCHVQ